MQTRRTKRNFNIEWLETRRLLSISFNVTPIRESDAGISSPIETAHFEGPANPVDLAVGNNGELNILSGNGNGTFTNISTIDYTGVPSSNNPFITGDFSGAGSDDLVLIGLNTITHNTDLQYETSNGNGTFTAGSISSFSAPTLNDGISAISAAASDLNGDGKVDLAIVAQTGTAPLTLQLVEMLSNGDGTFTQHQQTQVIGADLSNATPTSVLTSKILQEGSFGNGKHDLALYDGDSGHLTIFMNDGSGNLTQLPYSPLLAATIAVANLGGGTGDDIAVSFSDGGLNDLIGQGNGTFVANNGAHPAFLTTAEALAVGDFDIDGNPDLVTDGFQVAGAVDGTFGNSGPLPAGVNLITESYTENLVVADFNGDGRPDFAGLDSDGAHLLIDLNTSVVPSATTLTVDQSSVIEGGNGFTMTATVITGLPNVVPTGSVDFFLGNGFGDPTQATNVGTVSLTNGAASLSTGFDLGAGPDIIFAKYEGDNQHIAASQSTVLDENILARTSTSLSFSDNPVHAGDPVIIFADVEFINPVPVFDSETGFINFFDGTTEIGSELLADDNNTSFTDSTLSVGEHDITATFDPDTESFLATSTSEFEPLTILVQSLEPTTAKSTVPTAVVVGANSGGTMLISVKNNLPTAEHGTLVVSLFAAPVESLEEDTPLSVASTELATFIGPFPSIGNGGIKLGTAAVGGVLASGGTAKVSVRITTKSLSAGNYLLLAQVEGADGTTSDAITGPTLQVAAPFVQLAVTLVKSTAPSSAVAGQPLRGAQLVVKIVNSGNITAAGGSIAVYASADGASHDGTFISLPLHKALKAGGGSGLLTIPLRTTPVVATGTYNLLVQTTDSQGNLASVSAGQLNVVLPVVSLAASIAGITPAVVPAGKTAQLVINLTNNGGANSLGRLAVTLALLEPDRVTNAQPPVTISANHIVPFGGHLSLRVPLAISKSTAPGTYTVSVTVIDGAGNSAGPVISNGTLIVS